MPDATELIAIGKIERPFGVKGEMRVRSLSDAPEGFNALERVTLVAATGARRDAAVKQVRKVTDAYLMSFEGIGTPEEAAEFRGGFVKIPRWQTAPLPEHHYYEFELLGSTVTEESGVVLGTLEEILETPAHHVLVVRGPQGEHLLPATKDVVRSVDPVGRMVTVRWSAGLTETADAL